MTTPLNQASLGLAKEYSLTQAEYHALVSGFKIAMKFNPPSLVLQNSNLMAFTEDRMAFIQADYHSSVKDPLVKPLVTMALLMRRSVALWPFVGVHFRTCRPYAPWARRPVPAARRCLRGLAQ